MASTGSTAMMLAGIVVVVVVGGTVVVTAVVVGASVVVETGTVVVGAVVVVVVVVATVDGGGELAIDVDAQAGNTTTATAAIPYFAAVASSLEPYRNPPSPWIDTTRRSGNAALAPSDAE